MKYASLMRNAGLLMALSVALFVGCKKEKEQNGPSLAVVQGTVGENETRTLGIGTLAFKLIAQKGTGKDDADLKEWTLKADVDGAVSTITKPASGSSSQFDTVIDYNVQAPQVRTYTFTITDKNGKSARKSFTITFRDTTPPPPQEVIDSLVNQTYTNQSDNAGTHLRYSTSSNPALSLQNRTDANNNPSQILFVYWYSSSLQKHSVISPSVLSNTDLYPSPLAWTVNGRNETLFREAPSGTNFASATYQQIKYAFDNGTDINEFIPSGYDPTANPNKLRRAECTTGRLIAFKQGDIYGLIRVDNVNSNPASATLSVKIARP